MDKLLSVKNKFNGRLFDLRFLDYFPILTPFSASNHNFLIITNIILAINPSPKKCMLLYMFQNTQKGKIRYYKCRSVAT